MSTNTLSERRDKMVAVDQFVRTKIPALVRVQAHGMDAQKLAGAFTWAMANNPNLANTPPETVLNSLMVCSQVGLYPGPEGDAFLIPRFNGKTRRVETQFQAGYSGILKLCWRSGKISRTVGRVVRKGDLFEYEYGLEERIYHQPVNNGDNPDEIEAVYFISHLNTGAPPQFVVLTREQLVQHRDKYAPRNKKEEIVGPWNSSFEAMCLKTAALKCCKFAPTCDELQMAIKMDELSEAGLTQPTVTIEGEPVGAGVEMDTDPSHASGVGGLASHVAESSSAESGVNASSAPDLCDKPLKDAPDGFNCGMEPGHEGDCLP